MKKYIVIERSRNWDSFDFINEDTKNLGDIWHTHCPYKLSDDKKDGLRPMLFESRQDAVKYKNTHTTKPKSNEFVIIFYLKIGNLIPTLKILLTPKDMSEPVPISPHTVKCNPVLGLIFNCIYPVKGYGLTPNTIDICSFLP